MLVGHRRPTPVCVFLSCFYCIDPVPYLWPFEFVTSGTLTYYPSFVYPRFIVVFMLAAPNNYVAKNHFPIIWTIILTSVPKWSRTWSESTTTINYSRCTTKWFDLCETPHAACRFRGRSNLANRCHTQNDAWSTPYFEINKARPVCEISFGWRINSKYIWTHLFAVCDRCLFTKMLKRGTTDDALQTWIR